MIINKNIINLKIKNTSSNYKGAVGGNGKMRFRFMNLLLGTLGLEKSKDFEILVERIHTFITVNDTRKNKRMSFEYLKDCYLIMQYANIGKSYSDLKHNVAIREGYPKIIPGRLRAKLKTCKISFIAVQTLFGIHRIIPWGPRVELSSITDPFAGISETLSLYNIKRGLRNFLGCQGKGITALRLKPPRFLKLLSASPNGKISLYTSYMDAVAYLYYPKFILPLIKGNYYNKGHFVNVAFITLLILGLPIYFTSGFSQKLDHGLKLGGKSYKLGLGKLTTVSDVTGKTRVIALANYGLQISLKPLHDSISTLLKECPNDGTYDQMKPVLLLPANKIYSSFDLKAATDRLPVLLQRDILSLLIGNRRADLGRDCISIPFQYGTTTVNYAVGQPMGAYSSFAMLALTHHVIICSLYESKEKRDYAVLGDDMAIEEEKAEEYHSIITALGVQISKEKSVRQSKFIEFCKRIIDKTHNDVGQILSPKLITMGCMNPYARALLLLESFKREFLYESELLFKLGSETFGLKGLPLQFGLHLLFGPGGQAQEDDYLALDESGGIDEPLDDDRGPAHIFSTRASYAREILDVWKKTKNEAIAILRHYPTGSKDKLYSCSPSLRLDSELILFFMSPGFGVPLWSYIKAIFEVNPLCSVKNYDDFDEFKEILESGFDSSFLSPSKESVKMDAKKIKRFNENYNHYNEMYRLHYKWREDHLDKDILLPNVFNYPYSKNDFKDLPLFRRLITYVIKRLP